ncbi:hypothetical protein FA15DRAFT_760839, partial [Coprinopsis marcescibilis]
MKIWPVPCDESFEAYQVALATFGNLADIDQSLTPLVLQDEANVKEILSLFTFRLGTPGTTWDKARGVLFELPKGCPSIVLLQQVVLGRGVPLNYLCNLLQDPQTAMDVCEAFLSRLMILGQLTREASSNADSDQALSNTINRIYTNIYGLCSNNSFSEMMIQTSALQVHLPVIRNYVASNGHRSIRALEEALSAIEIIWNLPMEQEGVMQHESFVRLLDVGFLQQLAEITRRDLDSNLSDKLDGLLSDIASHSIFPLIQRVLSKIIRANGEDKFSFKPGGGASAWSAFWEEIRFISKSASPKIIKPDRDLGYCSYMRTFIA